MRLRSELELSLHVVEVCLVFLDSFFLVLVAVFSRFLWWLDLLEEVLVASEQFLSINLANFT